LRALIYKMKGGQAGKNKDIKVITCKQNWLAKKGSGKPGKEDLPNGHARPYETKVGLLGGTAHSRKKEMNKGAKKRGKQHFSWNNSRLRGTGVQSLRLCAGRGNKTWFLGGTGEGRGLLFEPRRGKQPKKRKG